MSAASKQGCDPAAAEVPGVPPALASGSAFDSPAVGPGDGSPSLPPPPPPPEVCSDGEAPKALLRAAEEQQQLQQLQEVQPEPPELEREQQELQQLQKLQKLQPAPPELEREQEEQRELQQLQVLQPEPPELERERREQRQLQREQQRAGCARPAPPPSAAQLVQKAHELMWYVLAKDQRRMVLWFPDMVRDVLGSYQRWCRGILRRTSLLLARVFGLHLRLTSLHTLEFSLVPAPEPPPELERAALGGRMPMMGLLLMILSLIYVKGRGARESAVWNVLRILGLRPWKRHSTFGDVRRLLTEELVQQDYLQYQRAPRAEPPEFEFRWGARATREISKLQIMEYLARVFRKDPQAWPTRYREALEEAARAGRGPGGAGAAGAPPPPTPCPRNSFSED